MDSIQQSHRNLDGSVSHGHSNSQGLHRAHSQGGATDNQSRGFSAEGQDQAQSVAKTIISYLNDKITTFLMSGDTDLPKIKIEGDLVTSFFDSVDKLSDQSLFNFIEDMKKDIELIMGILSNSTNEMVVFFTYLLMLVKKLNPSDHSFSNTIHMIKNLAREINEEQTTVTAQFASDFNKFFMSHLLNNYCSIIIDSPSKRQYVCELIFSHCSHDLQMRIKVVQSLKKHLKSDEVVYACQAFLIANEETFNEQWFDVFLYYALIGLSNPKVNIRVYSLNVLNTIAKHNAESILDITEKIQNISTDKHWEIKAQCLEFAITVLNGYRSQSHLIATKGDDIKKATAGGAGAGPSSAAPTGGAGGDRNSVKANLSLVVDIVSNCFNLDAPKSVQKIGLFKLQSLLPDFRVLYPLYMDVLVQTDDEIKQLILSDSPMKPGEEIFYSFGNGSFNYRLSADFSNFDPLLMANALIDIIRQQGYESLLKEHM